MSGSSTARRKQSEVPERGIPLGSEVGAFVERK